MEVSDSAVFLRELRTSRAQPPGLAGTSDLRRRIYNAALDQFEELLRAAAVTGPAAKPLPLFYALSQAGRAIAAARIPGDGFEIRGHGLQEHRSDDEPPEDANFPDVMKGSVRRHARSDGIDAFGLVSRALGSPDFEGTVEFGAAWAATPSLHRLPADSWRPEWRLALSALELTGQPTTGVVARIFSFNGNPLTPENEALSGYPTLNSDYSKIIVQPEFVDPGSWIAVVEWKGEGVTIDSALPRVSLTGDPAIIPPLPGQSEPLAPLMLMWLLAFSMSIFARYNPGPWLQGLSVSESTRAVPLETIMDQIADAIPRLVHDAIFNSVES